jgi:hypothetical protein
MVDTITTGGRPAPIRPTNASAPTQGEAAQASEGR